MTRKSVFTNPIFLFRVVGFFGLLSMESALAQSVDAGTTESSPATNRDLPNVSSVPVETGKEEGESSSFPASALPRPSDIVPDPILVDMRRQLRQLNSGKLDESVEIDHLFTFDLKDVKSVKRRVGNLGSEIEQLKLALRQTAARLADVETEIPEPQPSALLSTPPSPPPIPVPPVKPEGPSSKEPRGKPHSKRSLAWQERYNEWTLYRLALAAYEEAQLKYEKDLESARALNDQFEDNKKAYDAAKIEFETAKKTRLANIAKLKNQLLNEKTNIQVRLEIAQIRRHYLNQLADKLATLPEPAITVLDGLVANRDSIRHVSQRLNEIVDAVQFLSTHLEKLRNLVVAGSIVGFRVQRDDLQENISQTTTALAQRRLALADAALAAENTAGIIDQDNLSMRHVFYSQLVLSDKTKLADKLFHKRLADMRKGARSISYLNDSPAQEQDYSDLLKLINALVGKPDKVRSVADGTRFLADINSLIEKIDTVIDAARIDRERDLQAHRREIVTLLTSLASDDAKNTAYSLSKEVIADLLADVDSLSKTIQRWGVEQISTIRKAPEMFNTRKGVILGLRIVAAILLTIVFITLGRRIRHLMASGIRRFAAASFFRHRVGSLVKWAGLIEVLSPAILFAITAYAVLILIGYDNKEVKFVEVAVRWMVIYFLGRNLLEGLTRPISRGRPALIAMKSEITDLLSLTYSRLGLVLMGTAVVYEWTSEWLGVGLLSAAILWFAWIWVLGWCVWAMIQWRRPLGLTLATHPSLPSRALRFGDWISRHRIGALATPFASALILFFFVTKKIRSMLASGGILSYFQARSLKRLSRLGSDSTIPGIRTRLPEDYTKQFPLYPIYAEEDVVLLPREKHVNQVLEQFEKWRATKQDSSVVVLGEKGIGKTTFLSLLSSRMPSENIVRYSVPRKIRTEIGFVRDVAPEFGMDGALHVGEIAAGLNKRDETVIFLDEAHNLFLRTVDGYDAYEALVRLVNFTSEHVFWVIAFNSFSWAFLNQSKRRVHYFRRLLRLPPWSKTELQELIARRNKQSEFQIVFDEVLLDAEQSMTGQFEVIDSADGFFRLLWEVSRGNPRLATYLWLQSLRPQGEKGVRVGLFAQSLSEELHSMDRDVLFALAAICQHENLSVAELREVLNVSLDFAGFAVRYLSEYQLIEPKHTDPKRITLAPGFYAHVLKELRQNHLIFEEN